MVLRKFLKKGNLAVPCNQTINTPSLNLSTLLQCVFDYSTINNDYEQTIQTQINRSSFNQSQEDQSKKFNFQINNWIIR